MSALSTVTDKRALLDFPPIEIPGSASRDITTVLRCNRNVALIIWSYTNHFSPDFRQVNFPLESLGRATASKDPLQVLAYYNGARKAIDAFGVFNRYYFAYFRDMNLPNPNQSTEDSTDPQKTVQNLLAPQNVNVINIPERAEIQMLLGSMSNLTYYQDMLDHYEAPVPEKSQLDMMLFRLNKLSLSVVAAYLKSPLAQKSVLIKNLYLTSQKDPNKTAQNIINTMRLSLKPEDFAVLDEIGYRDVDLLNSGPATFEKDYPKSHALFSHFLKYEKERSDYLEQQPPQSARDVTFASETSSISDKIKILNSRIAAETSALTDQKPSAKTFQWNVKEAHLVRLT